jgi:hypothetical protein
LGDNGGKRKCDRHDQLFLSRLGRVVVVDGLAWIDPIAIRRVRAPWRALRIKALSIDWLECLDWHRLERD